MSKNIVFFGTSLISVDVFSTLLSRGIRPLFLVTTPDTPQGRHLKLTASPAKEWASKNDIEILQPEKLKTPPFADVLKKREPAGGYDVFIVASYGKIIPKEILAIPKRGILNVHPSLLPEYRGPSPIPSQILADDKEVGITVMQMDEKMDEGPIVSEKKVEIKDWPIGTRELKKILGEMGGVMLSELLPDWLSGKIIPTKQDHSKATYTKKFEKSDGEIILSDTPYQNYLKFQALKDVTSVFFFENQKTKKGRIKITEASYKDGRFVIEKVIPEGRKEITYEIYQKQATS